MLTLLLAGLIVPVAAHAAQDAPIIMLNEQTAPVAADGAIEQLEPGEFLWAPAIAPAGPVLLIVSLKSQCAYVYRNGMPIGVSTISSGRPGYDTPTGIFTILQKDEDHKSNIYNNAPMPFMQRLTWDGIALHAGNLPGYPASHGCIRLPPKFAKLLYGVTKLGLTVVITDRAEAPEIAPEPEELAASQGDGHDDPRHYGWHPEKARSGPVSIVVSGKDKRIVVLRNGVEIGFAAIAIDGRVDETEAFSLSDIRDGETRWLRLPLPGREASAPGTELTDDDRGRLHMPEAFRQKLLGVLAPGATLLITRDTLRSSGTGRALTVIAIEPED